MSGKNTLPQSINLLDPVNPPSDIWSNIYDWVFKVGRYILVLVEVIVLAIFFARFVFDRKNNDLTDEINLKVQYLSNTTLRSEEVKFRRIHSVLADINNLSTQQKNNSKDISSILSGVPPLIKLESFSYNNSRVNMTFSANDFDEIKNYESTLKKNSRYSDVSVNLSKTSAQNSAISFTVSFVVN